MENLKIKIVVNQIDTNSLGDWGREDLVTVAKRYQQFLAKRCEVLAKSEYPNSIVVVDITNNLAARNYSISVSDEVDNIDVLQNLETQFAHDNAWDIFCGQ